MSSPGLDEMELKGGVREARVVVERFMRSLEHLMEDHYIAFVHFIKFCRDNTYTVPAGPAEYLIQGGFLQENDDIITVTSKSLHNTALASAVGNDFETELESPYADED